MKIAFIGGSGIQRLADERTLELGKVKNQFGKTNGKIAEITVNNQKALFLSRHGKGHRFPPSCVNYQGNIEALKRHGADQVISISAVGSLREKLAPGTFVLVDQFIDRTFAREKSFFGPGLVAHVSMAQPVCLRLGNHLESSAKKLGIPYVRGGTYLAIEGPQFSTLAESNLYRSWGCDVIGMTNMPEAKLAREAELCYATVAMVTDYDCWHPDHDHVSVAQIVQTLHDNAEKAKALVREVVPKIAADPHGKDCPCQRALEHAVITPKNAWDPKMVKKLQVVAGRILNKT